MILLNKLRIKSFDVRLASFDQRLLSTVQRSVELGDGLGDRGEAAEVLPVADGGAARHTLKLSFRLLLLLASCVDDMPAAGHHGKVGG